MARRRASMREGPLAELFRATEAAQKQAEKEGRPAAEPQEAPEPEQQAAAPPSEPPASVPAPRRSVEPPEKTVEHVPEWEEAAPPPPPPPPPEPVRLPERAPEPKVEKPRPKLEPLPEPPPRLHRVPDPGAYIAVIRVVGVGGAGLNAVNRMIDADISQVEFVAVNTDIQQLQTSDAPVKIHIGRELTEGLGSGADPDLGRRAAEEAYDQVKRALRGSDMVFVTAGEGGGTGSGAAPVVARIARELGALTVGIVTTPFQFEGTRRGKQATDGVDVLRANCDTVIVVPNERLLEVLDRETSMLDAFRIADDVLRQGVQGICDLITLPGLINLDFADVRTIMKDAGTALMGIGFSATGENRARDAAERALRSPLIETDIGGAKGILLSIAGGDDLSLFEVNEAAEVVRGAATDDTNIIFGATVDDRLTGQVWVTVVATGFGSRAAQRRVTMRAETRGDDPLEPPSFLQT
jgi:cell division protein FtsZ